MNQPILSATVHYDAAGRMDRAVDALGRTSRISLYDRPIAPRRFLSEQGGGRLSDYLLTDYDSVGNLLVITDATVKTHYLLLTQSALSEE